MGVWFKHDTAYFRNRKIADLSKDAKLLDLAAIGMCKEQKTDGVMTPAMVRMAAAEVDAKLPGAVKELVAVRRWEGRDDGGYDVHDYREWQGTAAQQEANQKATRERVDGLRKRRRNDDGNAPCNGVTPAVTTAEGNATGNAGSTADVTQPRVRERDLSISGLNHQVSRAHEGPRQGSADFDSSNLKTQVNPNDDPVAARWLGLFDPPRRKEAMAALQRCRKHVAEHVIDQAIGRGIEAETPPQTPGWLLKSVANEVRQAKASFENWQEIIAELTGKTAD